MDYASFPEMDEDEQMRLAIQISLGQTPDVPLPAAVGGAVPRSPPQNAAPWENVSESGLPEEAGVRGPNISPRSGAPPPGAHPDGPSVLQHWQRQQPTNLNHPAANAFHEPFAGNNFGNDEDADLAEAIRLSLLQESSPGQLQNQNASQNNRSPNHDGGSRGNKDYVGPPPGKEVAGSKSPASLAAGGRASPVLGGGATGSRGPGPNFGPVEASLGLGSGLAATAMGGDDGPPGAPSVGIALPPKVMAKRGREESGDGGPPFQKAAMNRSRRAFLDRQSPIVRELYAFVFGTLEGSNQAQHSADATDVERWEKARFEFTKNHPSLRFGLIQKQGGPCGVLAAVQGKILQALLFGAEEDGLEQNQAEVDDVRANIAQTGAKMRASEDLTKEDLSLYLTDAARIRLLCEALADLLEQGRNPLGGDFVVISASIIPSQEGQGQFEDAEMNLNSSDENKENDGVAPVQEQALLAPPSGPCRKNEGLQFSAPQTLKSKQAVSAFFEKQLVQEDNDNPAVLLCFVFSLLLTRSVAVVKSEMDDSSTPLVARFGHCSQELVNLLLTGQATSNVFDGDTEIGGGLLIRGVQENRKIAVGYITELEKLRYVEVGKRYKHPFYPIWVVGSPTHYSILFSNKNAALGRLSDFEVAKEKVSKAFNNASLDGGGSGMCMLESLPTVVEEIGREVLADSGSKQQQEAIFSAVQQCSEVVFLLTDLWRVVCEVAGIGEDQGAAGDGSSENRFMLYHYDGQEPPKPVLRRIVVTKTDIWKSSTNRQRTCSGTFIPDYFGGQEDSDNALIAVLKTRWGWSADGKCKYLFDVEGGVV